MKKPNKYLIFALILAIINLIAVFLIFGVLIEKESRALIRAAHWMMGRLEDPLVSVWISIFRPLAPLLSLPFEFLGEGMGLLIQSIVFYLLAIYFIFKITEIVYKDQLQALFASIFYAFAIPALNYSLAFKATNFGSWFFCIFSIYLTLLYFKKRHEKLLIFNGLISGLGFLMKENGGLGILFFIAMVLLSKEFGLKEKVLKIIKFSAFFITPIILWEITVLVLTPFSHLDVFSHVWRTYIIEEGPIKTLSALTHLLALFATFGLLGWLVVLWGALKEWQNKNKERMKILLALVPFSSVSLIWPFPDTRHAFIVGTLGALLASYGLINLKNIFKNKKIGLLLIIVILSLYIVFNYLSYYFDDTLPFIDFENILNFLKVQEFY
ncbi:MAG: glycosyltransferase family 39 protein [Patescibacteria group bacterium]